MTAATPIVDDDATIDALQAKARRLWPDAIVNLPHDYPHAAWIEDAKGFRYLSIRPARLSRNVLKALDACLDALLEGL